MTRYLLILLMFFPPVLLAAEFKGIISTIAVGPKVGGGTDNVNSTVLVRVENQSKDAIWSSDCSTNTFWSFKFDSDGDAGKETYSLLLSAYMSGKSVVILGTGECSGDRTTDIQNLYYTRFDF